MKFRRKGNFRYQVDTKIWLKQVYTKVFMNIFYWVDNNNWINLGIMAILQTCCFFNSVRKGSYASGIYTLVRRQSFWQFSFYYLLFIWFLLGIFLKWKLYFKLFYKNFLIWERWNWWGFLWGVRYCGIKTRLNSIVTRFEAIYPLHLFLKEKPL